MGFPYMMSEVHAGKRVRPTSCFSRRSLSTTARPLAPWIVTIRRSGGSKELGISMRDENRWFNGYKVSGAPRNRT